MYANTSGLLWYARLPMGLLCIIWDETLHYSADVQTSDYVVMFYSEWHIASSHCCIDNIRATHDDNLGTLQHQHASYNKEYSYALLYDLYHCDYMVNRSFSVNIPHCSFARWLRSRREETVAQCWSGWHGTPLDHRVYVWLGWWRQKTSSEFKVAMLHYMSCVLIFTEWNLVPTTSLPSVIAMQLRQLCTKTNVHESSSTYSPWKRWWIPLATAMHAITQICPQS